MLGTETSHQRYANSLTIQVSDMQPTNTKDPEYYHKVVDCQYACPAHTPVPEYIRLIAAEKYTEAYIV